MRKVYIIRYQRNGKWISQYLLPKELSLYIRNLLQGADGKTITVTEEYKPKDWYMFK